MPRPGLSLLARAILAIRRAIRALVPGLIVAVPPLFWVVDATRRASLTSLGRDQGIFQYIAWALDHGAKDYGDVRDVNGPLTHLVHLVFLWLGGRDEHRFHVLDFAVSGAAFALVGACLPGIARGAKARVWQREVFERAGWAFAAWVVLSGQYLLYIFWDLAQRESFFDWFLLSSVALQLVAQARLRDPSQARSARILLAVAGALGVVTWFGKPTYAFFTVAQLLALLIDDVPETRKRRFATFFAGAVVGSLTQIAFLVRYADIGAFVRIYFVDVPAMYRFIWPRSAVEILSLEGYSTLVALSLVTSAVMLGLIYEGALAKRAIAVALLPIAGLCSVVIQSKGFPYHFHPVSAGLHLQWLLLVVWLWERSRGTAARGAPVRFMPVLAGAALAMRIAFLMPGSPYIQSLWLLTKARDTEERGAHDYLVYFQTSDFFPWEMRQTAAYLKQHTKPTDKVQLYGMDAYVLFLAERMSATPYIYAYDLNAGAALAGGHLPEPYGLHPNMQQEAVIRRLRDEHERDMLARLEKDPPAAFVFLDRSPLISYEDAFYDFAEHNPDSSAWVREHYRPTVDFNGDKVWMRTDLADKIAGAPLDEPAAPTAPDLGPKQPEEPRAAP